MSEELTVYVKCRVRVPRVPNFLQRIGDEANMAIEDLTDEELRAIGKLWTDELVAHATRRRNGVKVLP